MRHRRLTLALAVLGCAPAPSTSPWPADCPPVAPSDATGLGLGHPPVLTGTWEFAWVTLSDPGAVASVQRARISLAPSDSAHRAQHAIGRPAWGQSHGWAWPQTRHPLHDSLEVDLKGLVLELGWPGSDEGSVQFRLRAMANDRLWGLWEADLGFSVAVRDGRELPEPAGYFCARRRS